MPDLEATAHWSIHFCGEDADKVQPMELLEAAGFKIDITSANVSIYYAEKKQEKPKGSAHESESRRTHRTDSSIVPVSQGKKPSS